MIRGGRQITIRPLRSDGTVDPDREPIHLHAYSIKLDGVELIPQETPMADTPIPARPTKAAMKALADQLEEAQGFLVQRERELARQRASHEDQVATLAAERDEWRAARIGDPEAEALSGCVRAIDGLLNARSVGSTNTGYSSMAYSGHAYSVPGPAAPEATPVGRILLHLANRFGVPLVAATPPAPDADEPTLVSVPRRLAQQLIESGQAHG